jgi:sugar phosphate isomerase/epimerase
MKLACADFTFPKLEHDDALRLIGMLGFRGVDIGLFEGRSHRWPSREFRHIGRSSRELKRKAGDNGLAVADVFLQMAPDFRPFAINHVDAARRRKARDWFLKALEYAAGCGCRHVTTLPGVTWDKEPFEHSFRRSADELAWRVEQAKAHGITFSVEAHVGSLTSTPKLALRLVERVPGLTLTVDYTHFTRSGLPDSAVEPLLKHASHFHVRGAKKRRLQTTFAENTIDYARVLRKMRATGYRGWLGIEYVWIDWEYCNACDNISETLLFKEYLTGLKR